MVFMQRWSPDRALELIERERVNGTTGVPTMIWQLLESPEFPTATCRRSRLSPTAAPPRRRS
jgi:long-chain acyl-CoA synthetase